jgi:hypothetical protein
MIEPIQESRFEYKGYPCVVLFQSIGFRTRYVGIRSKKAINCEDIICHGGITYVENHLYGQKDQDILWIGFDCGHCFDGYDTEKIKEYYKDDEQVMNQFAIMQMFFEEQNKELEVRTLEYVEEECKKIVEQLILLEKEVER